MADGFPSHKSPVMRKAFLFHYNDVIMSAMESEITGVSLVTQPFVHTQINENIKAPRHWPLWGEVTGEFAAQRASNVENVSIWWRHHGYNAVVCFRLSNNGRPPNTYNHSEAYRILDAIIKSPTPFKTNMHLPYGSNDWCERRDPGEVNSYIDNLIYFRFVSWSPSGFTIQSWGCGRSTEALLCSDVYIFVHFCAWSDRNLVIVLNLRLNVQICADISTAI